MQEKRGRSKSEEKRQLIIQAAGELFVEHGFEKVSMEGIAKFAGVSKQTVYSHFSNYLPLRSRQNVTSTR